MANCKLKAIELYRPSGEYIRASEYVVTCMIAAGYRIDPTKEFCVLWIADHCRVLHPSVN